MRASVCATLFWSGPTSLVEAMFDPDSDVGIAHLESVGTIGGDLAVFAVATVPMRGEVWNVGLDYTVDPMTAGLTHARWFDVDVVDGLWEEA